MSKNEKIQIIVMSALTVVSVLVAWGGISGSAALDGDVTTLPGVVEAEDEAGSADFASLVTELVHAGEREESSDSTAVFRDPLRPYEAPKIAVPKPKPKPKKPSRPTYEVAAVIIDDNPRAIIHSGDSTTIVKVGDMLGGARVTEIAYDGVTVEGGHRYAYPSRR